MELQKPACTRINKNQLEKNMSSERRTNRAVLGGIFIIIAALGIGRIITGNRLNNGFMPNILPLAVKEIDQTKEIPLSGLQTIDVSTISADIQVSRTSGGTILARLTGKAGNAPELTAYTEGTTGTIAVKWPKRTNNNTRSMNLELLIGCTTISFLRKKSSTLTPIHKRIEETIES
jgi:hypothetical protein